MKNCLQCEWQDDWLGGQNIVLCDTREANTIKNTKLRRISLARGSQLWTINNVARKRIPMSIRPTTSARSPKNFPCLDRWREECFFAIKCFYRTYIRERGNNVSFISKLRRWWGSNSESRAGKTLNTAVPKDIEEEETEWWQKNFLVFDTSTAYPPGHNI